MDADQMVANFVAEMARQRTGRGWSQACLAKRLYRAPAAVSMWESGKRGMPLEAAARVAELFALDLGMFEPAEIPYGHGYRWRRDGGEWSVVFPARSEEWARGMAATPPGHGHGVIEREVMMRNVYAGQWRPVNG